MCAYSHNTQYLSRRPFAHRSTCYFRCADCGEAIYPEDRYAVINGERYHLDCLSDMDAEKLLDMLGIDVLTATDSDVDDGYDD